MSSTGLLFGTTEAPEQILRLNAGPLSVDLTGGTLRSVDYAGQPVCSAIAYLLRDPNWGTHRLRFDPPLIDRENDGFTVDLAGECSTPGAEIDLKLSIRAHPGRLDVVVDAIPRGSISTSRCGFVVVHPGSLAGRELEVVHTDGTTTQSTFPSSIDPLPVFTAMRGLSHRQDGLLVEYRFVGDDFEMEDQRNWGDYSFKSYVRPIRRPYPYLLRAGAPFRQEVSILFSEVGARSFVAGRPEVVVAERTGTVAPALSVRLDDTSAPQTAPLLELLRPNALSVAFDPQRDDSLDAAWSSAAATGAAVELEVVVAEGESETNVLRALAGQLDKHEAPAALSVLVTREEFCRSIPLDRVNDAELKRSYRQLLVHARSQLPGIAIGAGTIGFFTEVNRNRPPDDLVDFVSHAVCPTVHDASDDAVMSTVASIGDMVETARRFAPHARHRIGSLALSCRYNPYAPGPVHNPRGERLCLAEDDPRQHAQFGASWFLAAASVAAYAGIDRVGVGTLSGPQGVAAMAGDGYALAPAFHAARGIARAHGQPLRDLVVSQALPTRGFAVETDDAIVLWLANTSAAATSFDLRLPQGFAAQQATLALLDPAGGDTSHRAAFMDERSTPLDGDRVVLPAYAVAKIVAPKVRRSECGR